MNLVEGWFSALTTKNRNAPPNTSVKDLAADINAWNRNPTPFTWHRTADEILDRLARYCAAITTTEYVDGST